MSRYKLYNSVEHNKSLLHDTEQNVIAAFVGTRAANDIEHLKQYHAEYWYLGEQHYEEEMKNAILVAEWD